MHRIDDVLDAYDRGLIDRRRLLARLAGALVTAAAGGPTTLAASSGPAVRARTLNHVSIIATDLARSKAFYQRVAGLPVRDEAEDFCEFGLEGGFLGLYSHASERDRSVGVDHFCLGMDGYEPKAVFRTLKQLTPEAQPALEYDGSQVYVRDPDGVRVQFADVNYKR